MITPYEILKDTLSPLEEILSKDDVQEIMINAPDNIWVEERGVLKRAQVVISEEMLLASMELLARAVNLELTEKNPILEARLEDGSRVAGAIPPVSAYPCLSIRKFSKFNPDIEDYGLSERVIEILKNIVKGKSNFLIAGGTSSGKAQPLDALVLTPKGYKKIGTIEVGEIVLTPSGKHTKVTSVFPQGEKEVFKITFYDGRTVECTDEHLWKVWTRISIYSKNKKKKIRNMGWRVVKLSEINRWLINHRNMYERTAIPLVEPYSIEFTEVSHVIPPYTLGVLIGDGTLTYNTPRISNPNDEIYQRIESEMPDYEIRQINGYPIEHNLVKKKQEKISKIRQELERLGLHGKTARAKYIPEEYRFGTVKQRVDLIQGLMDTDGYVSKDGYLSYSTASVELAKNIQEIIWSLGGIATINEKQPYFKDKNDNKKAGLLSYIINIIHPEPSRFVSIKAKKERIRRRIRNWRLRIKEIKSIGKKQCQCIAVDDKDGLYVTDNYIVTHNTTFFNALLKKIERADRIVVIEDTKELKIEAPNVVRLEAKLTGETHVTQRDLVKLSLRLRPDKIILGEVRDASAYDLLSALNTGHSGGSTIHANSAREALIRLETLVLQAQVGWPYEAIKKFISDTINFVIYLERNKEGKRSIKEIKKITGYDGDYAWEEL